jgi:hypothetical protein
MRNFKPSKDEWASFHQGMNIKASSNSPHSLTQYFGGSWALSQPSANATIIAKELSKSPVAKYQITRKAAGAPYLRGGLRRKSRTT